MLPIARVAKLRAAGHRLHCGLRATDCRLRVAGHSLHCGLRATDCRLRVAGHRLRAAGCGPHIVGYIISLLTALCYRPQVAGCGPKVAGCELQDTDCGLRTTCGFLKLWVAKLQVATFVMLQVAKLVLRFARLFRLGGWQLLDLSGYNMWVTGYQTSENYSLTFV